MTVIVDHLRRDKWPYIDVHGHCYPGYTGYQWAAACAGSPIVLRDSHPNRPSRARVALTPASTFTVGRMRIGELARRTGTSARTLRYYEQHGLLAARRSANGYREYDEIDLRLVREIRALLGIGFALEETRPFVECLRSGHPSGAECPAAVEMLGRKLSDLDTCITRLLAVRGVVSRELAAAGTVPGTLAGPGEDNEGDQE